MEGFLPLGLTDSEAALPWYLVYSILGMDLPSIILCFTVPSGSRIIESCVNFGSMRSKNLIRSNAGGLPAPVLPSAVPPFGRAFAEYRLLL